MWYNGGIFGNTRTTLGSTAEGKYSRNMLHKMYNLCYNGIYKQGKNMSTTSYSDLHVRLDTDIKEEAEAILDDLGVSPSGAINIFYRQIINHDGMPFKVTRAKDPIPDEDTMTAEDLRASFIDAIDNDTYRPADEVFKDILGERYAEI